MECLVLLFKSQRGGSVDDDADGTAEAEEKEGEHKKKCGKSVLCVYCTTAS